MLAAYLQPYAIILILLFAMIFHLEKMVLFITAISALFTAVVLVWFRLKSNLLD